MRNIVLKIYASCFLDTKVDQCGDAEAGQCGNHQENEEAILWTNYQRLQVRTSAPYFTGRKLTVEEDAERTNCYSWKTYET